MLGEDNAAAKADVSDEHLSLASPPLSCRALAGARSAGRVGGDPWRQRVIAVQPAGATPTMRK